MNLREWALPVYTILMQLAVGALLVLWLIRTAAGRKYSLGDVELLVRNPLWIILFTVLAAMIASHFHLSRPFHSFYAVRNFRYSWLSREILFTVLFFLTLSIVAWQSRFRPDRYRLTTRLGWLSLLFGLSVVYCMARIYLLPTQLAWNSSLVIISFFGTSLLLGTMTIACLLVLDLKFTEVQKEEHLELHTRVVNRAVDRLVPASLALAVAEVAITFMQLEQLKGAAPTLQISLDLLLRLYGPLYIGRLVLLLATPLWMAYSVRRLRSSSQPGQNLVMPVYMSCLLLLIAEIIGRFLFYATHIRVGL